MIKNVQYKIKIFILLCLVISLQLVYSTQVFSAPMDYDNDGISNFVSIVRNEDDSLQCETIIDNNSVKINSVAFNNSDIILPASYTENNLEVLVLNNNIFKFANNTEVALVNVDNNLIISGANFDNEKFVDLAYSTNACLNRKSKTKIILNPLSEATKKEYEISSGKGNDYKMYFDTNADKIDELCIISPIIIAKKHTNRFLMKCLNPVTKRILAKLKIGKINNQPIRLKVKNSSDYLLTYEIKKSSTYLTIFSAKGKIIRRKKVSTTGEIIVGNYLSADSEQIIILSENNIESINRKAVAYDFIKNTEVLLDIPAGKIIDQFNIQSISNVENCYCTSKFINKNGNCKTENSIEPQPTENPSITPTATPTEVPDEIIFPNNCSNPPLNISKNDGFKCMSSRTRGGSIVCLLPYQFTWKPHYIKVDHHGNKLACNIRDTHFDEVNIVLKDNTKINLFYDGCNNYVSTETGPIGRQHFRNEKYKWDEIKSNSNYIEMIKNSERTCLALN